MVGNQLFNEDSEIQTKYGCVSPTNYTRYSGKRVSIRYNITRKENKHGWVSIKMLTMKVEMSETQLYIKYKCLTQLDFYVN